MSRFTMVLAAAVATAMIVIAIATLDAVGADKPSAANDITVRLADCMRSRGVAVPALSGKALEAWLSTHDLPEATARACKMAVVGEPGKPGPDEVRAADAADVKEVVACLRAHGFAAPADPMALKRWIGEQDKPAVIRALKECHVGPEPAPACGAKKVEPAGAPSEGLAEGE